MILSTPTVSTKWRDKPYHSWRDACPFLMPYDKEVCRAVDAHLSCERREFESRGASSTLGLLGKSNDYGASLTFHLTFYEIYLHGSSGEGTAKDLWKAGRLYNDPKKRWFRECACTVSKIFPFVSDHTRLILDIKACHSLTIDEPDTLPLLTPYYHKSSILPAAIPSLDNPAPYP